MQTDSTAQPTSRSYLRWIALLGVVGLFIGYFILNTAQFRPLLDINFWLLILIAIGYLLIFLTNGLITKFILRPFGKDLPLTETTYIGIITSVGNFFAPAGTGLAFRAVYLKRKHQVSYSDYLAILAGGYLIVFLVNSVFGLLALAALHSRADSHYRLLLLAFAALFVVSLIMASVRMPRHAQPHHRGGLTRLKAMLAKMSDGWQRIIHHPGLLARLTSLTTAQLFITLGINWLIIMSLHLHASLAALMLLSVIGMLSLFVNITPANLGVKEALYFFSAHALGFPVQTIILIALIDRCVSFLLMFLAYLALRAKGSYPLAKT